MQEHLMRPKASYESSCIVTSIVRYMNNPTNGYAPLLELSFCIDYEAKMARKNNDFNLIDYRLDDAQLEAFDKWAANKPPSFSAMMADFATADYKLSQSFVINSESWCVSITGKEDAKFNAKVTLTTWSDDVEEAIQMAYYKAFIIFEKGKWTSRDRANRG